jgi:hypothetical protein
VIPTSHIATAIRDLGKTGHVIIAMRQRSIVAPLAAYQIALAPTATARALIAMVPPVLPEIQVPGHG